MGDMALTSILVNLGNITAKGTVLRRGYTRILHGPTWGLSTAAKALATDPNNHTLPYHCSYLAGVDGVRLDYQRIFESTVFASLTFCEYRVNRRLEGLGLKLTFADEAAADDVAAALRAALYRPAEFFRGKQVVFTRGDQSQRVTIPSDTRLTYADVIDLVNLYFDCLEETKMHPDDIAAKLAVADQPFVNLVIDILWALPDEQTARVLIEMNKQNRFLVGAVGQNARDYFISLFGSSLLENEFVQLLLCLGKDLVYDREGTTLGLDHLGFEGGLLPTPRMSDSISHLEFSQDSLEVLVQLKTILIAKFRSLWPVFIEQYRAMVIASTRGALNEQQRQDIADAAVAKLP